MNKKTVLITGAASGFGKSAANLFIKQNFNVIAIDIDEIELEKLDNNIIKYKMDISNKQEVNLVITEILKTNKIDILVNNAGYGQFGTIENISEEQMRKQMDVNVFGLTFVTQAIIPSMKKNNAGRIINLSSVAGKMPSLPFMGYYYASKHAVEAISDALAIELKPFNINIIRINPNPHDTNFMKGVNSNYNFEDQGEDYQQIYQKFPKTFDKLMENGKDFSKVGAAIYKAATMKSPKTRLFPTFEAKVNFYIGSRWRKKTFLLIYKMMFKN